MKIHELSMLLQVGLGGRPTPDGVDGWSKPYPSAGARWPVEVYVAAINVQGLDAGVFHYDPFTHSLVCLHRKDPWQRIDSAIGGQVERPACVLILSAVFPRSWMKYGARGSRYAQIELGAAAMTATLAAQEAGLGAVWIGGFLDDEVSELIDVNWELELERPQLLICLGR